MTVRYGDQLRHLIFRWRASVWRVVWKDLLLFVIVYAIQSVLYRVVLSEKSRELFEDVVVNVNDIAKGYLSIQSMLLGFYVSIMVSRWWSQFELIPWPEEVLGNVNLAFPESDETSTVIRRSIARYLCLTFALAGRKLSPPVLERFKTDESLVEAGLMSEEELHIYRRTPADVRWFLPIKWIQRIVNYESKRYKVQGPLITGIQTQLNDYFVKLRKLFCYDWVNVPLVYTQVVAVCVYSYFAACTIGQQFINPKRKGFLNHVAVDYYIPVFTILQLVFFVGWFRVGQNLMKPFGDDDEDFELLNLLERNLLVAYELVDLSEVNDPQMKNYVPLKCPDIITNEPADCDETTELLRPPLYTRPTKQTKLKKPNFLIKGSTKSEFA